MSLTVKKYWMRNTCRIINDRGSGTGVVAETRMAFLAQHFGDVFYSYANLGLAFDAETIIETLRLF
jgi:hypothetical protein